MGEFIEFVALVAILWGLAIYRVKPIIWTVTTAIVLVGFSGFSSLSWFILLPIWVVFLLVAILFNHGSTRRRLFTQPLLNYFIKVLPPISRTEQEALDAGNVWWEKELFQGTPDWNQLANFPKPQLTLEEQAFLDNQVETLCCMLHDWEVVEARELPQQAWDYMKTEGFFGLCVDRAYGGHGFSAYAHSCVVTKVASRCLSAAVSMMVPNSLGPAELVYHYGTDQQKDYYLPRLARGEEIPCFGLTAPTAGSDASSIPDRGIVCRGQYEGKEVIGIKLSWHKRYITLAPIATLLGLAFKLFDPDHLLGDETDIGITLCLVPTDYPGVEIGLRHFPAGMAFMNGPTRGKDVFIPLDFVIGGEAQLGKGWSMLMASLSIGRSISLPALSTAVGKMSYAMTGAYATIRKQFKMPIAAFEGVEEALANIAGKAYIIEATRSMTASAVDLGVAPAIASALTKYHATELAREILDDAMDVHAGKAVQYGPKNYIAFGHQSIPVSITVEGANILTRNLMIFGQGVMRCHPYIQQELAAAHDEDKQRGLMNFDKLLCSHVGYAISNFAKTLWYGISGGRFIQGKQRAEVKKHYRQLTRMSTALAFATDMTLLLIGGAFKRRERLSARLGDVLSHLYMGSAVLRYFHEQGETAEDFNAVNWAMHYHLHHIQEAFDEFCANFPLPWAAVLIRHTIFPFGQSYRCGPPDKISHKIVKPMLSLSEFRQRFTQGIYHSKDKQDAMGCVEYAFQSVLAAQEADAKLTALIREKRIDKHLLPEEQLAQAAQEKLLTDQEIQLLKVAQEAVAVAIAVDDFTHEELIGREAECQERAQAL